VSWSAALRLTVLMVARSKSNARRAYGMAASGARTPSMAVPREIVLRIGEVGLIDRQDGRGWAHRAIIRTREQHRNGFDHFISSPHSSFYSYSHFHCVSERATVCKLAFMVHSTIYLSSRICLLKVDIYSDFILFLRLDTVHIKFCSVVGWSFSCFFPQSKEWDTGGKKTLIPRCKSTWDLIFVLHLNTCGGIMRQIFDLAIIILFRYDLYDLYDLRRIPLFVLRFCPFGGACVACIAWHILPR